MSQTDEDEWAKLRERVRNAPPGTAQTQWKPNELVDEPPRRAFPTRAVVVLLILGLVAGAVYFVVEHAEEFFAGTETRGIDNRKSEPIAASSSTPNPPAAIPAPAAKSDVPNPTVSIHKGARNINIRANPSSSSAVVGKLSGGDRAEKLAEQAGWVRLRFQAGGKVSEGWVRRDLLEP